MKTTDTIWPTNVKTYLRLMFSKTNRLILFLDELAVQEAIEKHDEEEEEGKCVVAAKAENAN